MHIINEIYDIIIPGRKHIIYLHSKKNKTKKTLRVILLFTLISSLPVCGQENQNPGTSLHMAALQGNIDIIMQHIEAGLDLNKKDAYGSTPLIIAIIFGKTEAALVLIEAGADMKIGDNYGSTPLHLAAFFGRKEIVKALLDNGADKYKRNNNGSTPFDIVTSPFEDDKVMYDKLGKALEPMGLKLDYEQIKMIRPQIAELLRPMKADLEAVDYTPLPGNDWVVSTPSQQGLDPLLIAELYLDAADMETLNGLLVIKNGFMIAEDYFNGGSIKMKSRLQSVTKSYTSAIIGIALDQGFLKNLDQKMIDFFPEIADKITDPRKKEITIREMLQMRAGYPWEETDSVLWKGLLSGHYLPLIEEFPLIADPGTQFHYSNLTSNWLGIILARVCGTNLKSFAHKNLFLPIETEVGDWGMDAEGHNNGCADLHFTARDAAKFGLLYLNEGVYKGSQIVPADWIKKSLQRYSDNVNSAGIVSGKVGRYFHDIGYGYHWWSASVGDHRFNLAWGHGGQFIVLLDGLDMIIVVTSYPFYLQHDAEAWKHEKANINLIGKFIKSLPKK